jgi:hypothetical protein
MLPSGLSVLAAMQFKLHPVAIGPDPLSNVSERAKRGMFRPIRFGSTASTSKSAISSSRRLLEVRRSFGALVEEHGYGECDVRTCVRGDETRAMLGEATLVVTAAR